MATVRFTATISGEFETEVDADELTQEYLRDTLPGDIEVDGIDNAELQD